MVTKNFLIYSALASTLLGGTTTYLLVNRNFSSFPKETKNIAALVAPNGYANGANSTSNGTNSVSGSSQSAGNNSTESGKNASQANTEQGAQLNTNSSAGNSTNYKISSQKGFDLIKPMLWAKPIRESQAFAPLKAEIMNLIENDQRQSLLTSASVYLYSFSDGEWTYINPSESFNPGSLIKVPLLMTYLKEAEKDPKLLDKKVLCENFGYIPTQTYQTNTINPGHTYTVRELLHYMIAYSDNNATNLLNKNVNLNDFRQTFTDLKIAEPDLSDFNYQITAKRYSRFFIVLYNATYLSRSSSEYALKLLTECDFKDGLVKGVPGNVPVAHKFGEWGNKKINLEELHESGIVYLNGKHYLLTVMTRGNNPKDLGEEISKVSRVVYDALSAQPNM